MFEMFDHTTTDWVYVDHSSIYNWLFYSFLSIGLSFLTISVAKNKYTKEINFIKSYETFLNQTKNIGMQFFLISPTPTFPNMKGGFACQEEWYRPSWTISPLCFREIKKSDWFASNSVSMDKIEKFLLANPNVSYIDAFSIICPDTYCKNHYKNTFIYRDNNHLSSYGAMKLKNTIETLLDQNKQN